MNSIVDSFNELGTSTIEQVSEFQSRVLEWNRQIAETIVPRFASMPGAEAFGGQNFAAEWLEASFSLSSKALEANRAFATSLVDVWTPKSAEEPVAAAKAKITKD